MSERKVGTGMGSSLYVHKPRVALSHMASGNSVQAGDVDGCTPLLLVWLAHCGLRSNLSACGDNEHSSVAAFAKVQVSAAA